MNIIVIFSVCVLAYSDGATVESYKTYDNFKIYEIIGAESDVKALEVALNKLDEDIIVVKNHETTQVLIDPAIDSIFKDLTIKQQLKINVIIDDFSELIKDEKLGKRGRDGFSWKAYYDVDSIYGFLRNMSKTFPESTRTIVAGKTFEGREILGLRINTITNNKKQRAPPKKTGGSESDSSESEDTEDYKSNIGKPVVFIESGIHAREWITPATSTYFINQLLTSEDPDIQALRDKFDWHIFPTVNPDGYHFSFVRDRMWRKSRSKSSLTCYGVDLNRNWAHNWGKDGVSHDPCEYESYCGSEAFSEVETRSLQQYVTNLENLLAYVGLHADAQMLLVPYSDSTSHDDNYNDLVQIGNQSLAYGYKVNGERYRGPATAAEILYKASGGSMDWAREALGTRLVYTYELRGTWFHWPPSRINEQGDELTQMMLGLFTEACKLGYC